MKLRLFCFFVLHFFLLSELKALNLTRLKQRCLFHLAHSGAQDSPMVKSILKKSGVVKFKAGSEEIHIRKVKDTEFDKIAPGTALVDSRTHQIFIVGKDAFNLREKDAEGYLHYGFSEAIKDQPFVLNEDIMKKGTNYQYRRPSENYPYSARAQVTDSELHRLKLPDIAKDYVGMNYSAWSSSGGEIRLEGVGGDGIQSTTIGFNYPEGYGSKESTYDVQRVSVFLGWGLASSPNLKKFQKIADEVGVRRPSADNPFVNLSTTAEIEAFYKAMAAEAGGLDSMVESRNQRVRRWYGQELEAQIEEFRQRNARSGQLIN